MALLHNDRAVLTKTKYAEYAAKNSLVTGGIVIPGKSARIKTVPPLLDFRTPEIQKRGILFITADWQYLFFTVGVWLGKENPNRFYITL